MMMPAFPRKVPPHLWAQILPGVNAQLALNVQLLHPQPLEGDSAPTGGKPHEQGGLAEAGIVDAPLVRAFNLLRKRSNDARE